MRVLFVASRLPRPFERGDQVRSWHQLRQLGRRHSIHLLVFAEGHPDAAALAATRELCERVEVVPRSTYRAVAALPARWLRGRPIQCALFDSREMALLVEARVREGVDLVHLQPARLDALAAAARSCPLFVDFIDALSLSTGRRASRSSWPLRVLLRVETRRLRVTEQRLLSRADRGAVVSDCDRVALGSPENLDVVPLGVDSDSFPFDGSPRDARTVVFSGNLGYFANEDAASWLATSVWPLVRRDVPTARLLLVGARPSRSVRRLGSLSEDITVTGRVLDMGSWLRRAAVAVAPMQSGAGQQFKVLEAMSSGTPVVVTPVGAAGLGPTAECTTVAAGPEPFARAIVNLLRDTAGAAAQAVRARARIDDAHSWGDSCRTLEMGWYAARERHRGPLDASAVGSGLRRYQVSDLC